MAREKVQGSKSKVQSRRVSAARRAAFEILRKISSEKAFSSVLLPLYEENLEAKDRALCHQITLGVLRNQIYLDKIIEAFTRKKPEKFDLEVLASLRLGLYQLVFLDKIPAYSAINESVNLVYQAKKSSAAGLVNAVLRRAAREKQFHFEFRDETERIAVETSHPRWLIERWNIQFGLEETKNLARANNQTGELAFRLTAKADARTPEILKKLGIEIIKSEISGSGWRADHASETLLAYAGEGKIYFQDEASQLVGEALNLKENESFLDVCAAPGSKTTHVAALRRTTDNGQRTIAAAANQIPNPKSQIRNRIVAGDLYEHRLRVLRETCRRTGAKTVEIIAYDAEKSLPFADESFDCVLVDAPCSGTGTIRRNPEIRYFVEERDFLTLPKKQLQILANASKLLKKGGRLIYSTCSLETEENEEVVAAFLQSSRDFQKASTDLPEKFLTADGFARTVPGRADADGFFIARLEKR